MAGAIRNQFNLVGNTLNSGTNRGTEGGGASGGGNTGTASATVQAAVAKDAKDWTLEEQRAVAKDIAAKGEASTAYAKAKAAMDEGTQWSIKLTNGKTLEYRIVGINHDDFADGSGKAGITFEATNDALDYQRMNATEITSGGWEKSELRGRLNSGDLWSLLPSELQSKVKPVMKDDQQQGRWQCWYPYGHDRQGIPALIDRGLGQHRIRWCPVRVLQIQGRDIIELLWSFVGLQSLDSLRVFGSGHVLSTLLTPVATGVTTARRTPVLCSPPSASNSICNQ